MTTERLTKEKFDGLLQQGMGILLPDAVTAILDTKDPVFTSYPGMEKFQGRSQEFLQTMLNLGVNLLHMESALLPHWEEVDRRKQSWEATFDDHLHPEGCASGVEWSGEEENIDYEKISPSWLSASMATAALEMYGPEKLPALRGVFVKLMRPAGYSTAKAIEAVDLIFHPHLMASETARKWQGIRTLQELWWAALETGRWDLRSTKAS